MKIAIAGATGLVGTALKDYFQTYNELLLFTRNTAERDDPKKIYWNPDEGQIDKDKLEGCDILINLAGETLMGVWTQDKKKRIVTSRLKTTSLLKYTLSELKNPPKLWLNASAIGVYAEGQDEELNEQSPEGTGFLSTICKDWEEETSQAKCRVVCMRFGIVLSTKGGALKHMLLPFRLGFGGKIGSGKQWMSWIALEEIPLAMQFIIDHPEISGPINFVSPEPMTNYQFTKALGDVLNRPTWLSTPETVIKLLLGEMGEELLLISLKVIPKKLVDAGYIFTYPNLTETLRKQLS